jgi:hypothetical protein
MVVERLAPRAFFGSPASSLSRSSIRARRFSSFVRWRGDGFTASIANLFVEAIKFCAERFEAAFEPRHALRAGGEIVFERFQLQPREGIGLPTRRATTISRRMHSREQLRSLARAMRGNRLLVQTFRKNDPS